MTDNLKEQGCRLSRVSGTVSIKHVTDNTTSGIISCLPRSIGTSYVHVAISSLARYVFIKMKIITGSHD